MATAWNFLGLAAALLLGFIASAMETAVYRVSRVRMRVRSDRGETAASAMLRVLDRLETMVTTILVESNAAAYAGTYFLTIQMARWNVPYSELITAAIVAPLFFVLTESLPKQLAYNNADAVALALVRVFLSFQTLLAPVVRFLNRCSSLLRKVLRVREEPTLAGSQRAMLVEFLNAGVAEKVLSQEQSRMAARIMQLEGLSAGDSMVPLHKLTLFRDRTERERVVTEMTRRRVQVALLVDSTGHPTGSVVTLAGLVLQPGDRHDPVFMAAQRLERIQAGAAIPEVLNLFRTRHARHALVTAGSRIVGLITTQSVLDRIAGTTDRRRGSMAGMRRR